MLYNSYSLYIPTTFEIIVLKNKIKNNSLTIILYNKKFSINILNVNNKIKVDIETYCLKFIKFYDSDLNLSFNEANKYLRTFEIYFFIKIKFKGKGFKIKFNKKLRLIKFYFGRSHITFYKLKKLKLKKLNKYKFLLKSLNLSELKRHSSNITYIKPVNVYTLRGIRISRQYIRKRKGKKSSYI